jgi:hypothetical protein
MINKRFQKLPLRYTSRYVNAEEVTTKPCRIQQGMALAKGSTRALDHGVESA